MYKNTCKSNHIFIDWESKQSLKTHLSGLSFNLQRLRRIHIISTSSHSVLPIPSFPFSICLSLLQWPCSNLQQQKQPPNTDLQQRKWNLHIVSVQFLHLSSTKSFPTVYYFSLETETETQAVRARQANWLKRVLCCSCCCCLHYTAHYRRN